MFLLGSAGRPRKACCGKEQCCGCKLRPASLDDSKSSFRGRERGSGRRGSHRGSAVRGLVDAGSTDQGSLNGMCCCSSIAVVKARSQAHHRRGSRLLAVPGVPRRLATLGKCHAPPPHTSFVGRGGGSVRARVSPVRIERAPRERASVAAAAGAKLECGQPAQRTNHPYHIRVKRMPDLAELPARDAPLDRSCVAAPRWERWSGPVVLRHACLALSKDTHRQRSKCCPPSSLAHAPKLGPCIPRRPGSPALSRTTRCHRNAIFELPKHRLYPLLALGQTSRTRVAQARASSASLAAPWKTQQTPRHAQRWN